MASRIELQTLLETVQGNRNVYFQPPENIKLVYPCIVYTRANVDTKFADDVPYATKKMYSVTVIDPDPDSPVVDRMLRLPLCTFSRHYKADNLNHDNFSLYF